MPIQKPDRAPTDALHSLFTQPLAVPLTAGAQPFDRRDGYGAEGPFCSVTRPFDGEVDLKSLINERNKRRNYAARGIALEKPSLPMKGEERIPVWLGNVLHSIDTTLPDVLKPGLTLSSLLEVNQPDLPRGQSSRFHKTLMGAGVLATGWIAFNLARQASGIPDIALAGLGLLAGQKLGGVISYLAHDMIDEYDLSFDSYEFQLHHENPSELTKWETPLTLANSGKVAVPLLGLLAALDPTLGLGSAAASFVATLWLTPLFHKWAHLRSPQKGASKLDRLQHSLISAAQKVGLIVDPEKHMEHHAGRREGRMEGERALPHTGAFDAATGKLGVDVNGLLDGFNVSQKIKRVVYLTTKAITGDGVKPHSWTEHPELEVYWGGAGTVEERRDAYREHRIKAQRAVITREVERLADADAQRPRIASTIDRLTARISLMKDQLEIFENPELAAALEKQHAELRLASNTCADPKLKVSIDKQIEVIEKRLLDLAPVLSRT